jgi:hypothetical protein
MRHILPDHAKPRNPIPDWDGDPSKLVIGLEEERFILNEDGSAPSLNQIKILFEGLVQLGYEARTLDDDERPIAVAKEFENGYLAVKMESFTHTIEVALPPFSSLKKLETALISVWDEITGCTELSNCQLKTISLISALPKNSNTIPTYTRAEWMKKRQYPQHTFNIDLSLFNGMITATQVHLNIAAQGFGLLPHLYEFDYLIPLLFSNSEFQDREQHYHSIRPLIWMNAFMPNYQVFGIPNPIPDTKDKYEQLIRSSSDYKKDYTFIAPRKTGSFEFRSACAQASIDKTLQMIALRIAILIAAQKRTTPCLLSHETIRNNFVSACTDKKINHTLMQQHLAEIKSIQSKMPDDWGHYLGQLLRYVN